MKALSIKQPWAGLTIAGIKNVENRTWKTSYRGLIAVVSTKTSGAADVWRQARDRVQRLGVAFPEALCGIDGCVLGVVHHRYLIGYDENGDPVTDHPQPELFDTAWWNEDGFGWIFESPRAPARPLPLKGRPGLYTLPADIETEIEMQLAQVDHQPAED